MPSKNWTATCSLSIIRKSDPSDPIKWDFFPSCSCVSSTSLWVHHMDANKMHGEKLNGNYTRMLSAILNKSWKRPHFKATDEWPLTSHLKNHTRQTRHEGHCWRSKDELINDVFLLTPTHGHAFVGQPARTFLHQLCEDTGYSLKDLPWTMGWM